MMGLPTCLEVIAGGDRKGGYPFFFFCRGIAGFVPPEGSTSRQKAAGQKRQRIME